MFREKTRENSVYRPRFLGQITPTKLKRPVARQGVVAPEPEARSREAQSTNAGCREREILPEPAPVPVSTGSAGPTGGRPLRGNSIQRPMGWQANGVVWVKRLQRSDIHPAVSRFRQPQRFSLRGRRPPRCGRRFSETPHGGCTQPRISDPQHGQLATPLDGPGHPDSGSILG